ncbi:MAG: radical SAM protein [Planctomycetaceae bacterium]|jgi:wyosine [tRNA(Phe)-imidazoG37] synthetase (radical SAM superfamily)|nr:radical SAM protein [Planctomycetaceae bacterium]
MLSSLIQNHPRSFRDFCYVYPVVSRRSGGLSIGVNLSLRGQCNFSCVYCQVIAEGGQKQIETNTDFVDFDDLESELRQVINMVNNGVLFQDSLFSVLPVEKRIVKDIAFSGDGEPTLSSAFPEAVRCAAAIRKQLCNESVKIVLITNATTLHSKHIQNAIKSLLENNGEIWAKLDAGTPEYFQTIARSNVKYEKIIENLKELTTNFQTVIQSCFLSVHGQIPDENEIKNYTQKLLSLKTSNILRVQIYTAARVTPESWALPLDNKQLDYITEKIRNLTGLNVETFYQK